MDDFKKIKRIYEENNIDELNQFIQSNSTIQNFNLLFNSDKFGNTEIVELLIPYVDHKLNDKFTLKISSRKWPLGYC